MLGVHPLAALGGPDALDVLPARYTGEDEDNRFATLKVYEYGAGDHARRLAAEAAGQEPDTYLEQLSREVAARTVLRGRPAKKSPPRRPAARQGPVLEGRRITSPGAA